MTTSNFIVVFSVFTLLLVQSSPVPTSKQAFLHLGGPLGYKVDSTGHSGGGSPPPTKNPFVTKPTPASKLTFEFSEEELICKKAERDSLQKDIWMYEIR